MVRIECFKSAPKGGERRLSHQEVETRPARLSERMIRACNSFVQGIPDNLKQMEKRRRLQLGGR